MSDDDAEVAREHGGRSFDCELDGVTYRIRLVESDPIAYEQFYNVVANPMLWFIQHYLWDLSNAPDIRQWEVDSLRERLLRREQGPGGCRPGGDRGRGGRGRDAPRLPPIRRAAVHPRGAPRRLPPPLRAHPVDPARRLARAPARHPRGDLRGHPRQRHRRLPHPRLPAQLPALLPRPVRPRCGRARGRGALRRPRGVGPGLPAADLGRDLPPHRAARGRARVRARDPAPPPRAPDPARGPRRPLEERPARVRGLRPLPRAAPRVQGAGHLHRPADPLAPGRAGVRRVPRADRGARGGGQPPPRHHRLDADRPARCARTWRRRSRPTSTTTC